MLNGESNCHVGTGFLYESSEGNPKLVSDALRPVVSIDLKNSGYTLVPEEDESGNTTAFQLKKNES